MRVAINAISAKKGGILTYTSNLIRDLYSRKIDFWVGVSKDFPNMPNTVPMTASDYSPVRRFIWEQTTWPKRINKMGANVLFSSANFGLLKSPIPQVLMIRESGLFDPLYLSTIATGLGVKAQILRTLRRNAILESARRADLVLMPTQSTLDTVLEWDKSLKSKSEVNPYGTLLDQFSLDSSARQWAPDGVVRLLYVSVYYSHKNPGLIAEAIHGLGSRGISAHGTITMDLDEIRQSDKSARDFYVLEEAMRQGHVTLGSQSYDAMPHLYHQHDVFIFPSVNETFGHPLIEAMASGIPVVAADIGVNREVCGDSALYFPPFSSEILTQQVARLTADADLRKRMIDQGRARVQERFSWNRHVDRLLDIFSRFGK